MLENRRASRLALGGAVLCTAVLGAALLLVRLRARARDACRARLRSLSAYERTLHALEGFLRQLTRTPHADTLVLRGSLLLRLHVPSSPRRADTLNFLALWPNDLELSAARVREVCAATSDDGIELELVYARRHSDHPEQPTVTLGVRHRAVGDGEWALASINLGWGEPLEPPARAELLPAVLGPPVRVAACARLESLCAWKLYSLFEAENARLFAAELFDCHLIATEAAEQLDRAALATAVRAAFDAHGAPLSPLLRIVHRTFGASTASARSYACWRASLLDAWATDAGPARALALRALVPETLALCGERAAAARARPGDRRALVPAARRARARDERVRHPVPALLQPRGGRSVH